MKDIVTRKNIVEVINFWAPYHDMEEISIEDLGAEDENIFEKCMYILTHRLRENDKLFKLFFLSEANYSTDRANELLGTITKPTKLAEYLNIKFYDYDEPSALINLFIVFEEEDEEVRKGLLDILPDSLSSKLKDIL